MTTDAESATEGLRERYLLKAFVECCLILE